VALDGVQPMCRKYQTPLNAIRNEFYLNYKYNYPKGSYDEQSFCTADDDNLAESSRSDDDGYGNDYKVLCDNSQTLYNKVDRWEMDAEWIRTKEVADAFLKIMMNWLTYRRWMFEATLKYTQNTLKLEVGDKVKINHSLLPDGVSDTRQFMVTRLVDGATSRIGNIDAQFMMIPEVI
jgi:hypothetical protein